MEVASTHAPPTVRRPLGEHRGPARVGVSFAVAFVEQRECYDQAFVVTERSTAVFPMLAAALAGCGGLVRDRSSQDGGGAALPDAESSAEGGPEGRFDGGVLGDDGGGAGWTQCAAPDGVSVCGNDACGDPSGCVCYPSNSTLELCESSPGYTAQLCFPCESDQVCLSIGGAQDPSPLWVCEPWNAGELFAKNGATSRVLYSDFSSWQGPNIPDETSCPSLSGSVVLCGGVCGECTGGGEICTGRSPLHPFGWCTLHPLVGCDPSSCDSGNACFTYNVDADAKAFASVNGYCLATELCEALAAQLPGGGTCTPQ